MLLHCVVSIVQKLLYMLHDKLVLVRCTGICLFLDDLWLFHFLFKKATEFTFPCQKVLSVRRIDGQIYAYRIHIFLVVSMLFRLFDEIYGQRSVSHMRNKSFSLSFCSIHFFLLLTFRMVSFADFFF